MSKYLFVKYKNDWKLKKVGRIRKTILFFKVAVFVVAVYEIYRYIVPTYPEADLTDAYMDLQRRLQRLVVQDKGSGCMMPDLNPYAMEVTRYDENHTPIDCTAEDWVDCHLSECYVKKTILYRMTDVVCIYRDIVYVDDDSSNLGEAVRVEGGGKYRLNSSDHVKVQCTGLPVDSLKLFATRWQGFKAGYRPMPRSASPPANALNVLMIIIDSLSKNNFIRRLPLSFRVLTDEIRGVVLDSYNIVGHKTDGAMFPILTGHNDLELPDWRRDVKNSRRVDPSYLLFSKVEQYGYRTAYFEDKPSFSTFNYRFNGFERAPVEHYLRPLIREALGNEIICLLLNSCQCLGTTPILKYMLDYSAQMFEMTGKKFCVAFSNAHSHDVGRLYISQLDGMLAQFLRKFQRDGHLEDTVLLVMSDHGQSFAHVRNTYQGKLEERLPFVSLVLPERLKKERPNAFDNLVANSKVLTTPFDIHTSILDALGLKHHSENYKVPGADIARGMSLLDPIPPSRSCAEAGVMPHWCACQQWHNVSTKDDVYKKVAGELARFVNQMAEQEPKLCAKRNILSIEWVYRKGAKMEMLGFKAALPMHQYIGRYSEKDAITPSSVYYQAKIVMDPGVAIFEATVLHNVKDDSFSISERDVSRINKYGDEPKCVSRTHPHLNDYCYCA